MPVKVACIQTAPLLCNKEVNVQKMCDWIDKTMSKYPGTQLIVFPELATTGYECGENFKELAEDIQDPESYSIKILRSYAYKYHVHIVYGFPERDSIKNDIIYNSQILIDDEGQIAGTYQKVHLFDSEKKWFTPGETYKVFDTCIGKLGLFICYDASFPEAARILALKGADILINSTNWEHPTFIDMELVMQARAFENTTFLICCNRIGRDKDLSFFGHSRILDPLGGVLTKQDDETEDVLAADLDFERMSYVRGHYYTMLSERRPDTYGLLIQ
ncbi:MAG: carbon-nitrogen hydrolase family protein [Clostridia bacterium]|jgi:predicted amidohydrolase|nr:carbon-nitrogen hydrolase family protein [Clostridia bacterium]